MRRAGERHVALTFRTYCPPAAADALKDANSVILEYAQRHADAFHLKLAVCDTIRDGVGLGEQLRYSDADGFADVVAVVNYITLRDRYAHAIGHALVLALADSHGHAYSIEHALAFCHCVGHTHAKPN